MRSEVCDKRFIYHLFICPLLEVEKTDYEYFMLEIKILQLKYYTIYRNVKTNT